METRHRRTSTGPAAVAHSRECIVNGQWEAVRVDWRIRQEIREDIFGDAGQSADDIHRRFAAG